MGKLVTFTEADYRFHNELEWYPGECVNVSIEDYGFGDTVVFHIQLDDDGVDDEGNPRTQRAMASHSYTLRSKLTKFCKGIFGEENVGPGKSVDLDLAIGERVEVLFEYGENAQGVPNEKITQIRALSRS